MPAMIIMVVQAGLLAPLCLDGRRRCSWATFAGVAALQLTLVNVHITFPIPVAMTAAIVADRTLRWGWGRWRAGDTEPSRAARQGAGRLGLLLLVQIGVCLVNPRTWRLAILPIQTSLYMRSVAAMSGEQYNNPWDRLSDAESVT